VWNYQGWICDQHNSFQHLTTTIVHNHHVTKVTKGVVTYYQVHDIINEEPNDRKGSLW
jgi:hypothetical protein